MKSLLDVTSTQISIFILFLGAGVSFEGAFSLWVSLKIDYHIVYIMEISKPWQQNFIKSKTIYDIKSCRRIKMSNRTFTSRCWHLAFFGLNSLRHFSSKIWNMIPDEIKSSLRLYEFEIKIRQWASNYCHCKLIRSYVQHVGYVKIIWMVVTILFCLWRPILTLAYYYMNQRCNRLCLDC